MEEDQREVTRLRIPLEGTATLYSGESNLSEPRIQLDVTAKDINASGGYFLTTNCPVVGDKVELHLQGSFNSKDSKMVFEAIGTVVRIDEPSPRAHGFAVQFDDAPKAV